MAAFSLRFLLQAPWQIMDKSGTSVFVDLAYIGAIQHLHVIVPLLQSMQRIASDLI